MTKPETKFEQAAASFVEERREFFKDELIEGAALGAGMERLRIALDDVLPHVITVGEAVLAKRKKAKEQQGESDAAAEA